MHEIKLRNQNTIHTIRSVMEGNEFFPQTAKTFRLVFHPLYNHFHPFVIAMLASWGDYWLARNASIECENTSAKGVDYAARMGLFPYFGQESPRSIVEREPSGQFVPLRKLTNSSDIKGLMTDLVPLLHSEKHAEAVSYCISELARNVLEHAEKSSAYVCAQYYRNTNRVSIGVADCGIGIAAHLSRAYSFSSEEEFLTAALKPGVSGALPGMYGAPDNAGAGLFYTKCIAHASGQYFSILSGSCGFRLRKSDDVRRVFNRDPLDDKHDLYRSMPKWNGTVVAVDIGIDDSESFSALMNRIRVAYGQGAVPKVRPKIRFT